MSDERAQTAMVVAAPPAWPEEPYKGLTFYGREDVPLFAGRSTDVRRVARILGTGHTRILLLHGSTGCGKSSFLRAGLIPFLEDQVGRFTFAKDTTGSAESALFVRCTHDPLLELASKAYEVVRASGDEEDLESSDESGRADQLATELTQGREAAGASTALSEERRRYGSDTIIDRAKYPTRATFTAAVAEDPERLVDVIGRLAYRQPRTQALVVDQAEEILTLKPGLDGEGARRRFFMFLAYLSQSAINFRLVVAFRTEYHGRFYASLRSGGIDATAVEDYYLSDLTGLDMLEAIKRPTSGDELPGYGVPREEYHFYYEDGLPELIVRELEKTPLASGALPVLQIVCRRLYQKAKASPPVRGFSVIRQRDYRDLGGIEGQIDLHLEQALTSCCEIYKYRLLVTKLENMRWRDVLSELARPQVDGSITTDVKPAKVLADTARFRGCKMPFDEVMTFLAKDEWRIVRGVELTKLGTNEKIACYSLGHDVLGGVLERWREVRNQDRAGLRRELLTWGTLLILASFFLPFFATAISREIGLSTAVLSWVRIVGMGAGTCVCLLAAIPNSRRFRLLYRPIYGFVADLRGLTRL